MKNRLVLLYFLLAGWYFGRAQSSLGIDSINFTAPGGATYNSQCLFKVNIVNYGPQPYNAQVDVRYVIDSTGTGTNMIDTSNSHLIGCTLAVGASQPDSALITIGPAFRNGINTVVIWPKTQDLLSTTHDSLKINFVVVTSGIENYAEPRPIIFPNPVQQEIKILSFDPKFTIERVRIFTVTGELIHTSAFKGTLNVSQLSPGVYFVELISNNGRAARYKIIKE
jgi:hypothetical protein